MAYITGFNVRFNYEKTAKDYIKSLSENWDLTEIPESIKLSEIEKNTMLGYWNKGTNNMAFLKKFEKHEAIKKSYRTYQFNDWKINGLDTYTIGNNNATISAVNIDAKLSVQAAVTLIFDGNKLVNIETDEIPVEETKYPNYSKAPKGFFGRYFVPEKHRDVWDTISNRVFQKGENLNILTHGASGYGKTSFFEGLAAHANVPVLILDCATMLDTTQWFGRMTAVKGTVKFTLSEFSEFIENGNCVVVFDELNRVFPEILNSLFPLFDYRGQTRIEGNVIKRNKSVLFGATENVGYEYVGTQPLDKAMRGRFHGTFEVGIIPERAEGHILSWIGLEDRDIDKLVKIFSKLRANPKISSNVSTRTAIYTGQWLNAGLPLRAAFDLAILNDADNEDRKVIIDILNLYSSEN